MFNTLKYKLEIYNIKHDREKLRKKIIHQCKKSKDEEILEIVDYLKRNSIDYFNYEWARDFKFENNVSYDEQLKMYYYVFNNRKMYLKRSFDLNMAQGYINNIFLEQSEHSPHVYFTEKDVNKKYNIVIDGGAAEGWFALSIIDKADFVYIVECDDEWIEALELTFKNDSDKVCIVKGFLSNTDDAYNVTIDKIVGDKKKDVSLIKCDIEGAELLALEGMKNVLESSNTLELLMCAYHYQKEENDIRHYFRNFNFNINTRKGYMFFLQDKNQEYPFFRRGVLEIEKE